MKGDPRAGRKRESRNKAPATVRALLERLALEQPELYEKAIKRGLAAGGARSYPFVALAAAVLAGSIGPVVGAIDLNRLRASVGVPDDDPDFETFMLIDSECDALPIGPVRQHWSADALIRKEAQVVDADRWAMEAGKKAFQNVVIRFAATA